MSVTTIAAGNEVTTWKKEFIQEYHREAMFARFTGKSTNNIIQMYKDLTAKDGKILSIPLVGKLTNSGVTGENTLEGNEENLNNYNHDVSIDQVRNAVKIGKMAQKATAIDILKAARQALKDWIMDDNRDDIISAMLSPVVDGVTPYASASEAQKDAWLAAQNVSIADSRVLFGAVQSNDQAGDHSASLSQIDGTTDVLDYDIVQLAKRMARRPRAAGGTRNIRPVRVVGGRESFVLFCEMFAFRDLKADTETIHKDGHVRGKENPLFTDPDLLLDGVICTEIPEISTLSNVGDSGTTDVSPNFFCGAQSIGMAVAQLPEFVIKRDFDYRNKVGVSIGDVRGTEKLSHNSVQNGQVSVYASGVADS